MSKQLLALKVDIDALRSMLSLLTALSLITLLSACALIPGSLSSQSGGGAQPPPLLIYDTSWKNGRADGDFHVGLMDIQSEELATVMIYVVRCGASGNHDGNWLMLRGPFESGRATKVVPVPVGISVDRLLPSEVNHLQITEVRGESTDGRTFDYTADVGRLLAPRISNDCPANP